MARKVQFRRLTDAQLSDGGRRAEAGGPSWWYAWLTKLVAGLLAPLACVSIAVSQSTQAQTFDEAATRAADQICATDPPAAIPDSVLFQICRSNAPTGVFSAPPSAASQQASAESAIERRLQSVRESEELRREASAAWVIPASFGGESFLVRTVQLQLPPAGGANPDIVVGPAQGLSLFVSAGATVLNHHNNDFEDGYEAQLPTVTIGADYWITPRLLAGIGINYTNFDGTYDDGGGFDKDIFSPTIYATFLPFDGAFVSAIAGYARNESSNRRRVIVEQSLGSVEGHTSADYAENQYSIGLQAGYDHPIGNFSIGPRLGFALGHSQVDSFKEKGETGFELRYSGLNQTSVHTSLGAAATVAIPIPLGVLLPQASIAWVHEYANDARNVQARYVEGLTPKFTFQRERPARNWANIGLGVSAPLLNGMQPFAQFQTVQGNENFVSYGGTAGLRFSF